MKKQATAYEWHSKYGKHIHHHFESRYMNGYSYSRYDLWYSNDPNGEQGVMEHHFCASAQDFSPLHSSGDQRYDGRCNCCYLNFSHTEARHDADVAKAIARGEQWP